MRPVPVQGGIAERRWKPSLACGHSRTTFHHIWSEWSDSAAQIDTDHQRIMVRRAIGPGTV